VTALVSAVVTVATLRLWCDYFKGILAHMESRPTSLAQPGANRRRVGARPHC
jgi:hypothetical protein